MKILKTAIKPFRFRWQVPAMLGLLALAVVITGGIYFEIRIINDKITNAVTLWEPELARAFASTDWLSIKRVGRSLPFDTIDTLSISSERDLIYSFPENSPQLACSIGFKIPIIRYGYPLGEVKACTSLTTLFFQIICNPLALATSIALALLLFVTRIIPLTRYRSAALHSLQALRGWAAGPADASFSFEDSELEANDPVLTELVSLVREGVHRRISTEREMAKLRSAEALGTLAAQVAHDIRSPLAALEMVTQVTVDLPEDTRILVREAVSRIRDIASSLLVKNRESSLQTIASAAEALPEESLSPQLLSNMVETLVAEKRMQFRFNSNIEIQYDLHPVTYGLFSSVQPVEFKRLVSNLINNSVESLGDRGVVKVRLTIESISSELLITIEDNGRGIPPEVLVRIGSRGETHNKQGGSGLGLYHARISTEKWGGKLKIESEPEKGTCVSIFLPRCKEPAWFASVLELHPDTTVIVVDDDTSIHQIWRTRFTAAFPAGNPTPKLIHFTSPEELIEWHLKPTPKPDSVIYLCDYELIGSPKTGLDAIDELEIGERSILVTSHFEEPEVRKKCEILRVKLMPKAMAGFVRIAPIQETKPKIRPDAILIDDDAITHMSWKLAAKNKEKALHSYFSAEEFLRNADKYDFTTPIYIDSSLKNGVKGEDIARSIHGLRFESIFLATGYSASAFDQPLPHIRAILGKDPPWGD